MTNPFSDHSRVFEGLTVAYPVVSRRSGGLSLGVNLNPNGACNYECVYCQVPRHELDIKTRDPSVEKVLSDLDQLHQLAVSGDLFKVERFSKVPAELRTIKDVSLSGDGEPSLYKDLPRLLAELQPRVERWKVSLQLISNGKGLKRPELAPGLSALRPGVDRIWLKADAWNQEDLKEIYALKSEDFPGHQRMLEDILQRYTCWLQICVYKRDGRIYSSEPVEGINDKLRQWERKYPLLERIQIYTLARQTFTPGLSALSDDELRAWSRGIGRDLRLPVTAYGESGLCS